MKRVRLSQAIAKLVLPGRFVDPVAAAGRSAHQLAANQKGLTLFEILIVIAIIGGLMAVIIPQVIANQNQAKVRQTKIAMSNIVQQLTMYQNDCGKYPGALEGLVKADDCKNWTGPYLKEAPKDGWNAPFHYESDGGTYSIKSLGADKKEGGDGVNKEITSEELQ